MFNDPFLVNTTENKKMCFFFIVSKLNKDRGYIVLSILLPPATNMSTDSFVQDISSHFGFRGHPRDCFLPRAVFQQQHAKFIILSL